LYGDSFFYTGFTFLRIIFFVEELFFAARAFGFYYAFGACFLIATFFIFTGNLRVATGAAGAGCSGFDSSARAC